MAKAVSRLRVGYWTKRSTASTPVLNRGPGTNPEELIGAAHAGCFTMALAAQLEKAGTPAKNLLTSATVTLDKVEGGFSISAVHLDLVANIPGADQASFERIANVAKAECPVSKLLNATITLSSKLET